MEKHDFKKFPELTNSEMDRIYWESPHKQIFNDFRAKCVKVHDGDTITLQWDERDFVFPLRFLNIAAPELKEEGGLESQAWLEAQLLGNVVDIGINSENRVGKHGRLLGRVYFGGLDIGEISQRIGHSVAWEDRDSNRKIKNIGELCKEHGKTKAIF